jgi:hypothetical protein
MQFPGSRESLAGLRQVAEEPFPLRFADGAGPVVAPRSPSQVNFYVSAYRIQKIRVHTVKLAQPGDISDASPAINTFRGEIEGGEHHALLVGKKTAVGHGPAYAGNRPIDQRVIILELEVRLGREKLIDGHALAGFGIAAPRQYLKRVPQNWN